MKNFNRLFKILAFGMIPLFFLSGCGESGGSLNLPNITPVVNQTWRFTNSLGDTADALIRGGAGTASSWTITSPGVSFEVKFGVQFSGSSVRLLTFAPVTGSNTGGISVVGNGTGTANGTFGTATTASGKLTLNFQSPIGPTSGTDNWTAVRIN